jgi:hypothetical protein
VLIGALAFKGGDRLSVLERFKIFLLWFFSTGLLAIANHFSGNMLTDWVAEALSIFISLPRSRLSDAILGVALLGAVAAPLIYFIFGSSRNKR